MNILLRDTDYLEYVEKIKNITALTKPAYQVITFGCQQNEADSERIRGILEEAGFDATTDETADIIILNTCAIRELAEKKVFSMLGKFKAKKADNKNMIIGVLGCMAAEKSVIDKLKKSFRYVDFTLEPNRLHDLPRLVYLALTQKQKSFPLGMDTGDIVEELPTVRKEGSAAWVSIMYGCNNFCTYCIVPYVRGRERSRDSSRVIAECRELVESGCKEITLLGQNVNSYRSDISFYELVKRISDIPGDFRLKFMTSHPKDVPDELIELFKENGSKLVPYFHLPLQSGSDKVLKRMNRTYNTERYLSVVNKLREVRPDIALSTDIIVGFPGETDEDFQKTLDILSEVRFDFVFAFVYSPREGTPAAKMPEQIDPKIKSERITNLLKFQDGIALSKNQKHVGETFDVLVDTKEKKDGITVYAGRTPTSKRVHFSSEDELLGEHVNIKITRAAPYDLYGELV